MKPISSFCFSEHEVGVLAVVSGHVIHGNTIFEEYIGSVADKSLKPAPTIGILILHPRGKRVDPMSESVCIRVMAKPEGKGTRDECEGNY